MSGPSYDRAGQLADFALHADAEGRFTYTCGWRGRILLHGSCQRKKSFQDVVAAHFEYNCTERSVVIGSH